MGLKQAVDDAPQRICAGSVSTHALRGESDREPSNLRYTDTYFNPRPPRGGRRVVKEFLSYQNLISIHALRVESDVGIHGLSSTSPIFQSTLSVGRATDFRCLVLTIGQISIHALREEGDQHLQPLVQLFLNFNPRPPRGERPAVFYSMDYNYAFQSTPSARRATGDAPGNAAASTNFNPRPPCGGRQP